MMSEERSWTTTSFFDNTSIHPTHDDRHHPNILGYYIFLFLFLAAAVVICVANVTLLVILCTSRKLHTKTNLLLASMASGDLGLGLTMPTCFLPYYLLSSDRTSRTFCLTCAFLNLVFLVSSITSLLCINAERYVKIVHPFRYDIVITKLAIVTMIAGSWLAAVGFGCLLLVENTWEQDGQSMCTLAATASFPLLCAAAVYSVVTLVTFTYCSGRLIHTARKQRKMIQALEGCISLEAAAEHKKDNHLAKMFVIIGLFYFLLLPYIVLAVYASLLGAPSSKLFNTLEVLACLIAYLNACVSPIICVYKDLVFRTEVKKLFAKCRRKLSCDKSNVDLELTSTVSYFH